MLYVYLYIDTHTFISFLLLMSPLSLEFFFIFLF